ncbi:unnamed protein product [Kuraishia capsulata CBS 1993]|uniref:ornithine carbamoyltransferase n=1 Tax=Kuraishia capsulata CBS 1993 TaxID=1382522 RepID=W6MJH2_9ASCO|nr:uncharacterized protein KUCA_T00000553001 [Kuraishia capsulata CBS 1993]CDK24587.1 unnamed protein product [Kuraishia capsulata CBS 1993]
MLRLAASSSLKFSRSFSMTVPASSSPRHLVSMLELSNTELKSLVDRALHFKTQIKSGEKAPKEVSEALLGKLVALIFSKRSTRTRISTEGAAVYFGGHPMFLGKDDIQLGVNESFYDTTRVVSSMTSCIFARVNSHSEIQELCKHSSVPIINALCDKFHPLQAIADLVTIKETYGDLKGLKLAWIGDSNNVINDLAVAALRFGINVSVATPTGADFDTSIAEQASKIGQENGAAFTLTHNPLEAAHEADILVTDTFVSMGQEAEALQKLQQFAGFQITNELAKKAGAKPDWKFMHCLPRHHEEVDDEVFYSDRSIVFQEAENRLYAALAAIEGFVINKGKLE